MAAATPSSHLQSMLQAAVQSVRWTYCLFWQFCPQQGVLVWSEGYYNGAIKTRKTLQPMELSEEEASQQRSQQLRELYESLLAGSEANEAPKRPCAALSPDDLTESEWFYLMCVSFSFPPATGLPGRAYARKQHVWLTRANEADSKTFSRAILAKSAKIQTVVCIPLLGGVVELGTLDKVEEDVELLQHIKSFFTADYSRAPQPALSEHSTSNPSSLHSTPLPLMYTAHQPPTAVLAASCRDEHIGGGDLGDDLDHEPPVSNSAGGEAAATGRLLHLRSSGNVLLCSPDNMSNNNNFDTNLNPQGASRLGQRGSDPLGAESVRRWTGMSEQFNSHGLLNVGSELADELTDDDMHYSQTVSTILQSHSTHWAESTSTPTTVTTSFLQSAFAKWPDREDFHFAIRAQQLADAASQSLLKYILFTVPFLHQHQRNSSSPKPSSYARDCHLRMRRMRRAPIPGSEELSANHVMAERRRREKLNERFIILRSLVPFVTKMDKASILDDTIEYVKQLRKKIQDLETRDSGLEVENRKSTKKLRCSEVPIGGGPRRRTAGEEMTVEVSIIESDALLEIQCEYREGILLDVMQLLRELKIETTTVQSSLSNGRFVAEIRARVKESAKTKKVSIPEVKRAIHQIIY